VLSVFRIVVVVFYLMTTNRLAGFVDIVAVVFDFWLFGCDVLLATKSRRHDVGAYSLHVTDGICAFYRIWSKTRKGVPLQRHGKSVL